MGKRVFIAEKPSVAKDFAKALHENFTNRDGYQENLPNGTKTFLEKAMERYEEIRKKPIEVQLSEEKLEKIHQIVENATSNLQPEVKGKRK